MWTSGTRRLSARRRCPHYPPREAFPWGVHAAASSSASACPRPLPWLRPPPLVAAEPATANHIVGAGFQRARGRGRVPSRAGRSIRLGHLRCRSRDRGQCLRRGQIPGSSPGRLTPELVVCLFARRPLPEPTRAYQRMVPVGECSGCCSSLTLLVPSLPLPQGIGEVLPVDGVSL